jgi:DNA-binding NtrC family response regulator
MTKIKIFIVDDDKFYANILEKKLNSLGDFSIEIFYNGQTCVDKALEQPDIIFLDYFLGDTTGIDVLQKIKILCPLAHVVILSGQKEVKIAIGSLKSGADEYLVKDLEDTEKRLNKTINNCFKIVMI